MSKLRKTEAGVITYSDPGSDVPLLEVGTLQCVHCGCHWIPMPGSGRVRGFCMNCSGPICGPDCAECIPTELMIENMEKGRPLDFRPVMVSVPKIGD